MKIAVIGTGYVGLVTGACFSEFGVDVTCVDVDAAKIDKLNKGVIPIYEPGLDQLVERNAREGRLHFTTDLASAIQEAKVVFFAVGTPPEDDGSPDMSYYQQAAKTLQRQWMATKFWSLNRRSP
jgi:UDPglucose 6-dehydrogenase